MTRARCIVFNAALGALDYRVPEGMDAPPGSVVVLPLGPRQILGVVWDEGDLPGDEANAPWPEHKLRAVLEVLPVPPLPVALRRLIAWCADYYLAPLSAVARMALSSSAALKGSGTVTEYRLTGEEPARMTPQRLQALDLLQGEQATMRELAEIAGVSEGVLRGMLGQGLLEPVLVDSDRPYPAPDPQFAAPALADEQAEAAAEMVAAVKAHTFQPFLLDGVTGSGKTETYFEAVAAALEAGRQVLMLLPEIALTAAFLGRFEARFGTVPVTWHSSLKASERRRAWRQVAFGGAKVVVGARSALFLPFADLGLVVVDEAHEVAFKQDDGVRYNARDVAVMRGHFEQVPVVLASATPALESLQMAEAGRYKRLVLPSRFGGAQLPKIEVVNLSEMQPPRGRWLAPPLVEALADRLDKGEQSLLFLNRRGYAPLTLCRHCGFRFKCPNCSAWLVEHRLSQRLACHHCGHEVPPPPVCPECGEPDCLVACGPGVERIADEVRELLPGARVAVVTSDTLASPAAAAEFVAQAEAKAIDVIVGTQLVTKGFHFPELTLVGVVDADMGLDGGDLRAAERTYQQIAQVAGRAGRGAKPGEVLIQTRHPKAAVIAALASGSRDAFYEAETEARRESGAPPFGRWAAIIVSSEDEAEAREAARAIGGTRPDEPGVLILGPAPAPLSLLRGRHRYRLLIAARRSAEVQKLIRTWLAPLRFPPGVRVAVDIDPYSFV